VDWRPIAEASALLTADLPVDEVLDRVLPLVADVMGAEGASVMLHDGERHELIVAAASGPKASRVAGKRFPDDAGIAGAVLRGGQARLVPDAQQESAHLKEIDRASGHVTRSLVAAPLTVGETRLGVLEAVNRVGGGAFGPADLDRLRVLGNLVAVALENARLTGLMARENEGLRRTSGDREQPLMASSVAMRRLLAQAERAAAGRSTVLLLGETGTGKELLAHRIHQVSPRARHPFVALNCGALPESLVESELFGHEKGAFTGADKKRLGRFELADGGTLFLDEIGELPASAQVRLLRVLQEREIQRVGGHETVRVDVRLIAATHRDLSAEVRAGRFREDLYFRVHVLPLSLPPLRERHDDIGPMARLFLERFAREMGRSPRLLPSETEERLRAYRWPGNVRELQNVMERLVVLGDEGPIRAEELAELLKDRTPPPPAAPVSLVTESLAEQERRLLTDALLRAGGNQSEAARVLQISRDQLRTRMKRYGLLAKG